MNLQKLLLLACLFSLVLAAWLNLFNRDPIGQPQTAPHSVSVQQEMSVQANANPLRPHRATRLPETMLEPPQEQPSGLSQFKLPDDPEQARAWARENPADAYASMMRATSGASRDAVIETVCAQVAQSDPVGAVLLAEHLGEGCTNLLENLVEHWADRDKPAAMEYATNRPAGEDRDRLVSHVAFSLSKQNPVAAATLVAECISPGITQSEAAISVLRQWASLDPNAAMAWAQAFPETLRDRAVEEVRTTLSFKTRGAATTVQ